MTREKFADELAVASAQNSEAENYWWNKLAGEPVKSCFPRDPNNRGKHERSIDGLKCPIPGDLFARLTAVGKGSDVRLFIVTAAGLIALLAKYTYSKDITIGTSIYRQDSGETFINSVLALRNRLDDNMTFKELIMQVGQAVMEANKYQNYPVETLLRLLNIPFAGDDDFPLFDTAILMDNLHDKEYLRDIHLGMVFLVERKGKNLELSVEYNSLVYKKSTMERIVSHFIYLLKQAVFNVNLKLSELEVLPGEEKRKILYDFNDTKAPYYRDKTVHRLFEEQVEKNPDSIAVEGERAGRGALSYRELNKRANQLARQLRKKGVTPNRFAAVVIDRTIEMVTAVMAIVKAGGAYVPLEPYLPDARIVTCLASLNAEWLLTNQAQLDKIREIKEQLPGLTHIFCLDQPDKTIDTLPIENPPPTASAEDIAYVIFTSGTTGVPKGVVEQHRPVVNIIQWVNKTFDVNKRDKLLLVASLSFDLSVYDIFGILAAGSSIRMVAAADIKAPDRLLEMIYKEGITFWDSAPAALQMVVSYIQGLAGGGHYTHNKSCLRLVFLSGDWIPVKMPDFLKETFEQVRVIGLGGGTEATIWSNFYPIEEVDPQWNSIPYGKPTQNAKYYILDSRLNPCPIGVPGNLYIGGECLAAGYINDIDLTGGKFIDNPFVPDERIYRTGDLARWFPDGNMEFLGRQDHQVKIRGFRIELGEIESQLLAHEEIKEAVVLARGEKSDKYLCAYYTANKTLTTADLNRYLAGLLPTYMIPSYFIQLDNMPVSSNGKLDRKLLPEPRDRTMNGEYTPPGDEVEIKLAEMWADILDMEKDKIGIDHNFFDLGGHSMKLVMLVPKIYETFGIEVPIVALFENPVIRKMSENIKSKRFVDEPVVLLNQPAAKNLFCFPPGLGVGISYQGLAFIIRDFSLYAFSFIEDENRVGKYIDIIKGLQPVGPYVMFGYSAAGSLIFQVTAELELRGDHVSDIILADSFWTEHAKREFGKEDREFLESIDENMEKMGMVFLKDKVKGKVEKYLRYLVSLDEPAVVHANLHLLLSKKNWNSEEAKCWDDFTTQKMVTYRGFGNHEEMFNPGALEKNAVIIQEILDGIGKN